MNPEQAERIVRDFAESAGRHTDPDLAAIKAAVFLEDVFGIRLTDEDIVPSLSDPTRMTDLIGRRYKSI